jgi:hypothetical protein
MEGVTIVMRSPSRAALFPVAPPALPGSSPDALFAFEAPEALEAPAAEAPPFGAGFALASAEDGGGGLEPPHEADSANAKKQSEKPSARRSLIEPPC